ncbi:phage tail protein [Xanthobacter sp. VTT E-85241]|uniref:phage tail-collar fiber domain-containing protein n=1 Tax=Roseixanthobacter finlandensis TaxID=3119922 RepID=UPI0037272ECB
MAQQYYGLLTNVGLAKLAAAAAGGSALALATMGFGDGGGAETAPAKTATALVNERYRANVVEKYPHPTNPAILYVEGVIPSGIGGWTMREAGIFDSDGDLIVIAKPPAIDVALISEGASTEGIVRLPLVFESLDAVTLLIDPTVVLATQGWVLNRLIERPFVAVDSVTTVAPPASPATHSLFVVPAGASGAWATEVGKLAYYKGGWIYRDSPVGKVVAASDTGKYWRRTADAWVEWVATDLSSGLVELGTLAEVMTGTDAARVPSLAHLAVAVQRGRWAYAVAGGTASALTVTLNPAIATYSEILGTPLRVMISAENAGPATLNVNGIGAQPIQTMRGATLNRGDLPAGAIVTVIWAGSAFLLSGVAYSDIRIKLTGDATVYVSNAGSDSTGDGSAAHPWATIEHAYNQVRRLYDTAGYQVTISCAPGTYVGGTLTGPLPGLGMVYILGSGSSPSDVVIGPLSVQTGAYVRFDRVRHSAPTSAGVSAYSSNVYFMDVDFGPCLYSHVQAYGGSFILFQSGYKISAGGQNHIYASGRSYISYATPGPIPVAITGTPSFTDQFAWADSMSTITAMTAVYAGSCTGQRHTIDQNSLCVTGGGGVNFFPGSVAGAVSNDAVFI